jgi:hypothetical protein
VRRRPWLGRMQTPAPFCPLRLAGLTPQEEECRAGSESRRRVTPAPRRATAARARTPRSRPVNGRPAIAPPPLLPPPDDAALGPLLGPPPPPAAAICWFVGWYWALLGDELPDCAKAADGATRQTMASVSASQVARCRGRWARCGSNIWVTLLPNLVALGPAFPAGEDSPTLEERGAASLGPILGDRPRLFSGQGTIARRRRRSQQTLHRITQKHRVQYRNAGSATLPGGKSRRYPEISRLTAGTPRTGET